MSSRVSRQSIILMNGHQSDRWGMYVLHKPARQHIVGRAKVHADCFGGSGLDLFHCHAGIVHQNEYALIGQADLAPTHHAQTEIEQQLGSSGFSIGDFACPMAWRL